MNIKEIVAEYPKSKGFDGLWSPNAECGCKVDDLAPCGGPMEDCEAGYLMPCNCGEHDWHIGRKESK